MPGHPDLPIEMLPAMLTMLERNTVGVKKWLANLKSRVAPSTQTAAAERLREFQQLRKHQTQIPELEAQRDVWLVQTGNSTAELERFSSLLEAYKTALEACLELALTEQSAARAATGFEGMDEAWRDPKTGQYNHPIGHLPLMREMLEVELEEAGSLQSTLQEALPKPHVLDDETLNRVDYNYGELAADNLAMHGWQLERWIETPLSAEQKLEVSQLQVLLERYRLKAGEILKLSQRLRAGSIDRVMEKVDVELGLEYLLGSVRKPGKDC